MDTPRFRNSRFVFLSLLLGGVAAALVACHKDESPSQVTANATADASPGATKPAALPDTDAKAKRLVELNVLAQVANVARTSIVRAAWASGRNVTISGWVFGVADGLIREVVVRRKS